MSRGRPPAWRRRTRSLLVVFDLVLVARVAGTVLIVSQPLDAPDAIVSLASHEWERLPLTASLARQYPSALVLLTLPPAVSVHNCHDCAQRVEWLVNQGVAAHRIRVLPLIAPGTYGEATACRDFASQVPVHRFLIVTSRYHTRRALAVFRDVFMGTPVEFGVAPASPSSPARPQWWLFSPYDRWHVSYEWAAMVYYAIHYGVNPLVP